MKTACKQTFCYIFLLVNGKLSLTYLGLKVKNSNDTQQ